MPDRGTKASIVLEGNAADPAFDLVRIFLAEVLYHVKFDVAAALAGKAIYRVSIADRLERFAHKNEAFFFDFNNSPSGMRVRLQWISRDRSCGRRRLIEQYRDGNVTLFPE